MTTKRSSSAQLSSKVNKKQTAKKSQKFQELVRWFVKFRLQNGVEGCYPISTSEKNDLWERLPKVCINKGLDFFEFESKTHRILMQSSQLMFFQFLFECMPTIDLPDADEESTDSYPVKIYFIDNPNPMIFQVEVDEPDLKDEGNQGELNNFVYYVLNVHEEEKEHLLHFTDEDGETAFFRGSSLALIEIPLEVLQTETEVPIHEEDENLFSEFARA